jgi:hypothetical protein
MTEDLAGLARRAISTSEQVAATQAQIVAQQARSKRTVRVLTVSVLLDIILSVACVLLAINQHHVTDDIRASQLAACQNIGNTLRAREVQLWEHAIRASILVPPHETAGQRQARAQRAASFLAYVKLTFRQVDCARLYPG